jgi:hypothetical protein
MTTKSQAIVDFLGNLIPLYWHVARDDAIYAARSLQDGTLIQPVEESSWEEECGIVRVHWHGDPGCESMIVGSDIATIALERYVRLHGVGAREEDIAAELWFLADHFHKKTGCELYLPNLKEPPHPFVRAAKRIGDGVLTNLVSKLAETSCRPPWA